jgi:hypothetical protein
MPAGYVYAFTTPSMPGVVKIGATDRDPTLRLAEANARHTWCPPEPYVVACTVAVDDAFATERAIHALLAPRRVTARREFFRLTDAEARALFAMVAPTARPCVEPPAAPAEVRCSCGVMPPAEPPAEPTVAQTPEGRLRAWVEEHYTHVPLREKDRGTKLEAIYTAYTTAVPSVHARPLGKILFAKMLNTVFPNVGPHKDTTSSGYMYLLR